MGRGGTMRMLTLESTGTGTSSWDLGTVFPLVAETKSLTQSSFEASEDETSHLRVDMVDTITVE